MNAHYNLFLSLPNQNTGRACTMCRDKIVAQRYSFGLCCYAFNERSATLELKKYFGFYLTFSIIKSPDKCKIQTCQNNVGYTIIHFTLFLHTSLQTTYHTYIKCNHEYIFSNVLFDSYHITIRGKLFMNISVGIY